MNGLFINRLSIYRIALFIIISQEKYQAAQLGYPEGAYQIGQFLKHGML
jgi:hypothetical protein